jgi:S1-C subfamily serine protease
MAVFSVEQRLCRNGRKRGVILAVFVSAILAFSLAGSLPVYGEVSVSQLYQNVQDSVVVITDTQPQTSGATQTMFVQGSGFVYNFNGRMVIITNYHVIAQGTGISVTFRNGNGYAANVIGADPYADLAVLTSTAPSTEYKPLQIVSSSSLSVGDFVAAFGSPFGLSGSITTGIVSQIGRTITETTAGNYPIANVIQTDAPINPGNSGGPLLNSDGSVVGINTAGVTGSTGVGFAIPSDTILREINSLVTTGTYTQHSYLGITSVDMSYDIANHTGVSVTYGVLVQAVTSGGPAATAGIKAGTSTATIDGSTLTVGGDIITALNGTRIINGDQLSSYLEQNASPGQTLSVTVLRNGQTVNVPVVLGTRPAPSGFSAPTPLTSATIPEAPTFTAIAVLLFAGCTITLFVAKRRVGKGFRRTPQL